MEGHAGVAAAEVLRRHGVEVVFTLSGGHIFPLYDGLVPRNVRLLDTRHEQTAAFAAEGWSKLTRRTGVAALTAGPGVTNAVSTMANASQSGTPMLVIGGRAPQMRWGAGSLQEFDHLPVVASVTRLAITATQGDTLAADIERALVAARTAHRGPAFIDVPLDVFASPADAAAIARAPLATPPPRQAPDGGEVEAIAQLLVSARHPVVMAGADVYWDRAEDALLRFATDLELPVFCNGLGRGTIPADHANALSRARSAALRDADVIVAVGTPLDFRLRFGDFGAAKVVHIADSPQQLAQHVHLAAGVSGDIAAVLDAIVVAATQRPDHTQWLTTLRDEESRLRENDANDLRTDASPIKPSRIYGELLPRLDRDAVVIGDGGDFVSYAGRYVDTFTPGCFLDPGPFGCLGTGAGYAIAARLAHPTRQVVLLLGDGAAGFSLMDFDTLVRHGLPVVAICGNNGIWGLEKHPMHAFFGYDVAADLRQGTRYDEVVRALGGHGELVTKPGQIGPALDRAFAAGVPALVNVLTDPDDAYPRSANLV